MPLGRLGALGKLRLASLTAPLALVLTSLATSPGLGALPVSLSLNELRALLASPRAPAALLCASLMASEASLTVNVWFNALTLFLGITLLKLALALARFSLALVTAESAIFSTFDAAADPALHNSQTC